MLNKRKLTLTISLLLIVLGVFGSLALVKRSQDLRRSAALTKTTIRLNASGVSGAVDETVIFGILIDTPRKVSTAKVKLCYGDALTTDVSSITNVGPLTVENSKKIENNCVIISKRVEASATIDQMPTGSFQFANVTFKIKKNGNLTISQTESLIAGEPISGDDVNIPIDEVVGATVTVGSGGGGVSPGSSSLTFESSDLTSKKVNESLSFKLYLTTTKNFDAAEVKFCYGDKLSLVTDNGGIVKGADFTDIAKQTITNNCLEYAVLATSKSLTGKILLGTFSFKAVATGSGTLAFDNNIRNYSNATDGLMKVENTPSVNYTINSTTTNCTAGAKQCVGDTSQICRNNVWVITKCAGLGCNATTKECNKMDYVCTDGDTRCYELRVLQTCKNNVYEISDGCSGLGCSVDTDECNTRAPTATPTLIPTATPTLSSGQALVNIKLAFAGVKSGNGRCAKDNWLVKIKLVNSADNTAIGGILTGFPTQTTSVNSRREIIYDFSVTVPGVSDVGVNKSAFFLTGPKHVSVKYGEDDQARWFPNLAGNLSLTKGSNSYDFSDYPLLAGDVNGDGKIDGRDYSYLKGKANNLTVAAPEGSIVDGDINGDCQANSGDVRLMIDSLKEINGQTY